MQLFPSGCWWAIVTVTTVGYGDLAPKSTIGKLLLAQRFCHFWATCIQHCCVGIALLEETGFQE